MTLNYAKHKDILLQILKDIYADDSIAPYLGFKGGTAALLFYGLDRQSVDLDFDLLDTTKETAVLKKVQKIMVAYGTVSYARPKRFSLLSVISYASGAPKIKVEINRRDFGSCYQVQTFLGISVLVMTKEDMFAHKLMAMVERIGKTSRDVYDVYFFFRHGWDINQAMVEKRAGQPYQAVLAQAIASLEAMDNKHILDGLGDLLTDAQKDWARAKLKSETLFQLRLALSHEE